jgi:FkbM family methyltransferase
MIVRHFDVSIPKTEPPQNEGWEQAWYGYHRMTKCWSEQMKVKHRGRIKPIMVKGELDESSFERDCLLSVLADIKREHVNMFELGAGWGEWCLALAGVIDNKIIPVVPTSYRCLAVEGEPTHYQWLKEHFEGQNINGIPVHGAVSKKNGTCRFSLLAAPDASYGQAISFHRLTLRGTIRDIYCFILRKRIEVQMYTIDHLVQAYRFDHVDIIDIDVQGAEYEVMLGAADSIKNDLIDYLIIGTHYRELNDSLRKLLSPKFDLAVDIYPNSVATLDGFPPIRCQDGIQLYRRKNI